MSPSQIEMHSIKIRAWLIKMIVEGLPEGTSWVQSFTAHICNNMEVNRWFKRENFVEFRNSPILEAISTLFPHQYIAGDAIKLAIKSLNIYLGSDSYLADVLLSHLPTDRILRILATRTKQFQQKIYNTILVPINVKSTHWYLGVLQRQKSGEYQLQTQNNCTSIRNEQAENNLQSVGNVLSRWRRQASETDTPIKYQHERYSNTSKSQGNKDDSKQDGRSRQLKNNSSRCLLMEITNSQDHEESESEHNSQSSELVDYGTESDTRVQSFEDYDWEQDRMISYHTKDQGGIKPKE